MAAAFAAPASPSETGPGTAQVVPLTGQDYKCVDSAATNKAAQWTEMTLGLRQGTARVFDTEYNEATDMGAFSQTSATGGAVVAHPHAQAKAPTVDAERIVRAHFAGQILADLQMLAAHCREAIAARYASSLLRTIRTMRDVAPLDPFVEVLMALHDALAFENRWADYEADQYQAVHEVLKKLTKPKRLTSDKAEKALMELEDIGFDTTPFAMEITDEE